MTVEQRQQVGPDGWHRLVGQLDGVSSRGEVTDEVHAAPVRVHRRVVLAGVPATAFMTLQSRLGYALRDIQHVAQVQRQVPTRVELAMSLHGCVLRARTQALKLLQGLS